MGMLLRLDAARGLGNPYEQDQPFLSRSSSVWPTNLMNLIAIYLFVDDLACLPLINHYLDSREIYFCVVPCMPFMGRRLKQIRHTEWLRGHNGVQEMVF